jgi:hypothetical protein
MQQVTCPGCGAPVEFKSTASVLAVCGYCKTTLLKDADSVKNLGKMSEVLEDYSPLQIGSSGRHGGRGFSVIGRIQLQYSAGFWNEWYVMFDDGGGGWLSDASGQYALTVEKQTSAALPLFDKLVPGRTLRVSSQLYTISDVRTARCTAGQGELPFKVGPGWEARVADFRARDRFMTLDYSDATAPRVYVGDAVELESLSAQLLRDPAQISDAAGRFRGKVAALNCPSCGSALKAVTGITVQSLCPSCHAQIDTAGSVAVVLAAGAAIEAVHFTLELGARMSLDGLSYTVIGALRRSESDGSSVWSEYLLYTPGKEFIWLVETDAGWQRAQVMNRWPDWDGADVAGFQGRQFARQTSYDAVVVFAVGSFNWRVAVGDRTRILEFANHDTRLAAEVTREEMTWSWVENVPLDQVRAWFGRDVHAELSPLPTYRATARKILFALALINVVPLFAAPSTTILYSLLAALGIYLPAYYLDRLDAD